MSYSIKVDLDGDVKLISKRPDSFKSLQKKVLDHFPQLAEVQWSLRYKDSNGEFYCLTNDDEYCAMKEQDDENCQEKRKLFIYLDDSQGSDEAHQGESELLEDSYTKVESRYTRNICAPENADIEEESQEGSNEDETSRSPKEKNRRNSVEIKSEKDEEENEEDGRQEEQEEEEENEVEAKAKAEEKEIVNFRQQARESFGRQSYSKPESKSHKDKVKTPNTQADSRAFVNGKKKAEKIVNKPVSRDEEENFYQLEATKRELVEKKIEKPLKKALSGTLDKITDMFNVQREEIQICFTKMTKDHLKPLNKRQKETSERLDQIDDGVQRSLENQQYLYDKLTEVLDSQNFLKEQLQKIIEEQEKLRQSPKINLDSAEQTIMESTADSVDSKSVEQAGLEDTKQNVKSSSSEDAKKSKDEQKKDNKKDPKNKKPRKTKEPSSDDFSSCDEECDEIRQQIQAKKNKGPTMFGDTNRKPGNARANPKREPSRERDVSFKLNKPDNPKFNQPQPPNPEYKVTALIAPETIPPCIYPNERIIYQPISLTNSGKTKWPENCMLRHTSGIKGPTLKLPSLDPGKQTSTPVSLEGPAESGQFCSVWEVVYVDRNGKTQRIGNTISIEVDVLQPRSQSVNLNQIQEHDQDINGGLLIDDDVEEEVPKEVIKAKVDEILNLFPSANREMLSEFVEANPKMSNNSIINQTGLLESL